MRANPKPPRPCNDNLRTHCKPHQNHQSCECRNARHLTDQRRPAELGADQQSRSLQGLTRYQYCSRHLHSMSVSTQLLPLDRTSVWARTLLYTYQTVISLFCIMHHRALINDDSDKRATGDMKSLVPMGPWQGKVPRS